MDNLQKDIYLISKSRSFLLQFNEIDDKILNKHLKPNIKKDRSLNDIYERLCASAQNRQMHAKVIGGSIQGVSNLSKVLFDFDPKQVSQKYELSDWSRLLNDIINKLHPSGKIRITKRSIWPLYCKTVIECAYFLSNFNDIHEFNKWISIFSNDPVLMPSLPLIISEEISGIGFPLACDFLKEIGLVDYGKPDVHIKDIFKEYYSEEIEYNPKLTNDYNALKRLIRIAKNNNITTYEVDKLLWLIGSGNFYRNGIEIGSQKNNFYEYLNQ